MGYPKRFVISGLAPIVLTMAIAACSSDPDDGQTDEEHVWKEQTETIDKAREVETILKRKQQQQENQ